MLGDNPVFKRKQVRRKGGERRSKWRTSVSLGCSAGNERALFRRLTPAEFFVNNQYYNVRRFFNGN
jgi:hypothetical protein